MASPPHHCYLQLLSCVFVHHVLGSLSVPYQNVILSSKNFTLFLTWTPTGEHPPETLYEVEIKPKGVWLPLPNCTAPTGEGCDITCMIEDCYYKYQARVRSSLPRHPGVWSMSARFSPFDDVELGAPEVKVDFGEKSVMVHLQIKLSTCKEKVFKACLLQQLSYQVEFWNADESVRRPIRQSSTENTMEIQKGELRGSSNCISARSVFTSTSKLSNFSEPVCFSLKRKELPVAVYLAIMGSSLGLFLISIVAAIVKKIVCDPSEVKTPATLDFTKKSFFTQMMADVQPDVCKLSIIVHCEKLEDMYEQNMALERRLLLKEKIETSVLDNADCVLDNADCTDESDEENEFSNYTDNRWIPDGMIFDEEETFHENQQQAPNAETYQKANCSFLSTICAIDVQSQDSECTDHSRLQTKPDVDVSNPSSFTSAVLNSKPFSDCINSIVLEHDEKSGTGDIPLKSVQILCCNDDDDDDGGLFSDDAPLLVI